MLGRRLKSALYIDFENVPDLCPPHRIANWVWWLSQGTFDSRARRRQFVEKNIYWGPKDRRHGEVFKQKGFNIIECDKFHVLKNGADIRIALDVMEAIILKPEIEEFILFAKDTDYTPVLQRLKLKKKKSVILADEQQERVFSLFAERADIVIPVRIFREAPASAPPEGVWARANEKLKDFLVMFRRRSELAEDEQDLLEPVRTDQQLEGSGTPTSPTSPPSSRSPGPVEYRPSKGAMAAAIRCVIRATSPRPNSNTPRREIERELKENVRGFKTNGTRSYLGYGSFAELMKAIQLETNRIRVYERGGGFHVQYIPEDD